MNESEHIKLAGDGEYWVCPDPPSGGTFTGGNRQVRKYLNIPEKM